MPSIVDESTAVLYNIFSRCLLIQSKLLKFICLCNTLLQTTPARLRSFTSLGSCSFRKKKETIWGKGLLFDLSRERNAAKMRQRWKKSYYLSWLPSRCLFLKIVIICTQPTAHQEHLHTRTQHINIFFLPFYENSFFLSSFCESFVIFSSPFLSHSPCLSWCIVRVYFVYTVRTHAQTHALIPTHHRHNAHACCTTFVDIIFNKSTISSSSMIMQQQFADATHNTHTHTILLGALQSVNPNEFQDIEKPNEIYSFVRWPIQAIFLPDLLQMPAPFFSDSYNNARSTFTHTKDQFCTEAHCNPQQIRWFFML